MPGERALFKPDEESKPIVCKVKDFLKGDNDELQGYRIIFDDGKQIMCSCEELFPIPGEKLRNTER